VSTKSNQAAGNEPLLLPLPEQQRPQAASDVGIYIAEQAGQFRRWATDPKERHPSDQIGVDPGDAVIDGLSPGLRRKLPDFGGETIFRSFRRQYLRLSGFLAAPEVKPDEVPLSGSGHRTLVSVHLET